MPAAFRQSDIGQPISAINTTPIIDVMLVLLVMMILSLPAPTHKIPIDLPTPGSAAGAPPPIHRIDIAATGALSWDGAMVSAVALDARLAAFARDPARPQLHIATAAETPYFAFNRALAQVKRAGIERIGFVGNPKTF